jgi:hypothetical protein
MGPSGYHSQADGNVTKPERPCTWMDAGGSAERPNRLRYGLFHLSKALARRSCGGSELSCCPLGETKRGS